MNRGARHGVGWMQNKILSIAVFLCVILVIFIKEEVPVAFTKPHRYMPFQERPI